MHEHPTIHRSALYRYRTVPSFWSIFDGNPIGQWVEGANFPKKLISFQCQFKNQYGCL
jgi:hypothetical protein